MPQILIADNRDLVYEHLCIPHFNGCFNKLQYEALTDWVVNLTCLRALGYEDFV